MAHFCRPPSGAFQDSDPEPTAYAVGYLLPLLRSFRRGYDCNKVSCVRGWMGTTQFLATDGRRVRIRGGFSWRGLFHHP